MGRRGRRDGGGLRLTGRLDEASVAIAAARAEGGSISYDEPVDLGVYDAMLEGVS